MTTEQITAIAERMAKKLLPDTLPPWSARKKGYTESLELVLPHLLDLMGRVEHEPGCEFTNPWNQQLMRINHKPCTCGLDDRLTAIKQLIEP